MAAILTPTLPRGLRTPSGRPLHLDLLEGGRSAERRAATYRRRRLLASALATVMVLASFAGLRAAVAAVTPQAAASPATPPGAVPVATVRAGDTLWSIARRLQPAGDLRPVVDRLAAGRAPGALQPGEVIFLRRRSKE